MTQSETASSSSGAPSAAGPSTGTSSTSRTLYPALRFADAPAAIEWLTRAFGFTVSARYDDEDGTVAHAELLLGDGMIMLGSDRDDGLGLASPARAATMGMSIYAYVPDPDAHCTTALAAGAELVRELKDTPYGSREYSVRDLEGHLWTFGSYRP